MSSIVVLRTAGISCLFAALSLSHSLCAQAAPKAAPAMGKLATEALVARYEVADHWVQKVVGLLSLNQQWHPEGVEMVLLAIRDRDPRLRAFGIEALLRSDADLLPKVATTPLLAELIGKQLGGKNRYYKERVGEALKGLLPNVDAKSKRDWSNWWRNNKETHQPEPWQAVKQANDQAGGTAAASQRAFDLYQDGLDMLICIDSTGSMQPTIDALADAIGEMAGILNGVSPKMRLGVVQYKDNGELGKTGAKLVQSLSKNIKSVRKKLGKLRAYGGNDLPEAVLGGLSLALSKSMKWQEDANKIAVLIGDAPPHPQEKQQVIDLARQAFEDPGSLGRKGPKTGAKTETKPFLTSAIGVFLKVGPGVNVGPRFHEFEASQRTMRTDFEEIAKAGGGVFVEVEFEINSATPPSSKEKREAKKEGAGIASAATQSIVEHILVLSFGERFKREMTEFVRIFYAYKKAGMIK
jgi:hypothetical protein